MRRIHTISHGTFSRVQAQQTRTCTATGFFTLRSAPTMIDGRSMALLSDCGVSSIDAEHSICASAVKWLQRLKYLPTNADMCLKSYVIPNWNFSVHARETVPATTIKARKRKHCTYRNVHDTGCFWFPQCTSTWTTMYISRERRDKRHISGTRGLLLILMFWRNWFNSWSQKCPSTVVFFSAKMCSKDASISSKKSRDILHSSPIPMSI